MNQSLKLKGIANAIELLRVKKIQVSGNKAIYDMLVHATDNLNVQMKLELKKAY